MTLTSNFDLLLKKKHMIINFLTESDQSFITHVYSLWQDLSVCTKKFLTSDLDLQLWPTFEKKPLTLALIFELKEKGFSYYAVKLYIA